MLYPRNEGKGRARIRVFSERRVTSKEEFHVCMMARAIEYALLSGRFPGHLDIYLRWHMPAKEADTLLENVCTHCSTMADVPRYIIQTMGKV